MNTAVRNVFGTDAQDCFEIVKYALTRRGEGGEIEYASHRGWTTDRAQADMRVTAEQAPYAFPRDIAAQGVVSRITMRVYEGAAMFGQTGEAVVVARDYDSVGAAAKGAPSFVTHAGVIGARTEVSNRAWQAVVYAPDTIEADMARHEINDIAAMAHGYGAQAAQPTYKIGDRKCVRPQRYAFAILHYDVQPV